MLAAQVVTWLNTFVAPHMLISVSFHEEAHPDMSEGGTIHAKIAHNAGSRPSPLTELIAELPPMAVQRYASLMTEPEGDDPLGPMKPPQIYSFELFRA